MAIRDPSRPVTDEAHDFPRDVIAGFRAELERDHGVTITVSDRELWDVVVKPLVLPVVSTIQTIEALDALGRLIGTGHFKLTDRRRPSPRQPGRAGSKR